MNFKKILFVFAIIALVVTGCKKGGKKKGGPKAEKIEAIEGKPERLALNISGMTCEIGCAKLIESKLSKQDGVLDAKVIFGDSLAKIKFDPAKTNKATLMSFVGGIAENMYSVSEADYKESCDAKKSCSTAECEKACSDKKKECSKKKDCDKKKSDCSKGEKNCSAECAKKCEEAGKKCGTTACVEACAMKEKSCSTGCEKECCV